MRFNERKIRVLYVLRDRVPQTVKQIYAELHEKRYLGYVSINAIYMACMRYTEWGDLRCILSVPIQYQITRKGFEKLKWFLD